MHLVDLGDDALVEHARKICCEKRKLDVAMLECLAEVEARQLHLKLAFSSLFDFCTRGLGMSEGSAFRRITAARLMIKHPRLADTLRDGRLNMSTLTMLRDHLSEANYDDLIAASSGRSKREVADVLARLAPRPDVPARMRKLPAPARDPRRALESFGSPGQLEPLAPARHRLELTVDDALRAKIERARALLRHRNPSGDLAAVLEHAVDALLTKLEKERLAVAAVPPEANEPNSPSAQNAKHIPAPVRRAVFARDGERCSFVAANGLRCSATGFLELDHVVPQARGGKSTVENLRVLCRAHNQLAARLAFGSDYIRLRQRKSQRVRTETDGMPGPVKTKGKGLGRKATEASRSAGA